MRIISGLLKKYRFSPPKGFPSRPTTDFAKEGLFNILDNRLDLQNLDILDLFAGTGNISFEFASREAGNIWAVDKNYKCVQFIQSFSREHKIDKNLHVFKADVFKFLNQNKLSFDLIFADPPFDFEAYEQLVQSVMEGDALREGGLFALEHSKNVDLSTLPKFRDSRKYGHIVFSFFQHNS